MNAAKVINTESDMSMSDFCADCMEEEVTSADAEPYIFEIEVVNDLDPDLRRKLRDATSVRFCQACLGTDFPWLCKEGRLDDHIPWCVFRPLGSVI
jgi:hypothetical protein